MSLLTDPRICPDCRASLDAAGTCTGCGLRLTGPLAAELWRTMQTADGLVQRLRGTAPAPAAPLPAAPPLPRGPETRKLPGASVPVVLFAVGGLCLLVAAIVFVAVAWSSFGLGTRATILTAVTLLVGGVAARLTRRGLRGAAETFWFLVAALVTIDLTAAYSAGLLGFDQVAGRHAAAVLGTALLGLGLGVGAWAHRRTGLGELVVPALTAAGGAAVIAAAEAWTRSAPAVPTAASVVALGALVVIGARLRLRLTAYAVAAVAATGWLVLVGEGVSRLATASPATWFGDLSGWPLVAAAVLAGVVAAVRSLPEPARLVTAGAAEICLLVFAFGPGAGPDSDLVVACGLLVVTAAVAVVLPRVWSLPATGLTAIGLLLATCYLPARPFAVLDGLPTTGPVGTANLDLRLPAVSGPSPWTAIVLAVAVVLTALALAHLVADPARRETALRTWSVLAPTTLALGVAVALLESSPTLVVAVAAWALALAVLGLLAAVVRGCWTPALLGTAGYAIAVGLRLAVPSHLLVALLAAAIAVGLAVASARARGLVTRAVLSAGVVLTAGFSVTHAVYLVGGRGDAAGIALVLVAGAAGLLAGRVSRSEAERLAIELTALAAGLAATAFPVHDATVTVVLTLLGTAVALVSIAEADRDQVAWLGTAILGIAAVLRLDAGLAVPELATAPAAALLLAAGYYRLTDDPRVSSVRALGSGLTLALLPSLLIALDEPVSVRGALVGLLAVLALAVGVGHRWAAPFLAGAGSLAVLAVRHLGPIAEGLPRWISLGTVGVALLAVAITWEARRRELDAAERYLTALR